MFFYRILLTLLIAGGSVACDNTPAAPAAEANAPAVEAAEADEEAAALAVVEVPEEGKEFDPPVEVAQVPAGAYYCDMGTAHYARMHEGDGTCPLCHMKLKKK